MVKEEQAQPKPQINIPFKQRTIGDFHRMLGEHIDTIDQLRNALNGLAAENKNLQGSLAEALAPKPDSKSASPDESRTAGPKPIPPGRVPVGDVNNGKEGRTALPGK